jgi:hypothetical protein
MELTLRPDEARLLREVLVNQLDALRSEIVHTDRYALRQELKQDEEIIKTLIARLAEPAATPA